MSINKTFIGISVGLLILACLFFFEFNSSPNHKSSQTNFSNVTIEKTWELPDILEEVSGIDLLGNHEIAAVQDETGTIFIYNLQDSEITDEVEFAGPGDYEGIAVHNSTAYIVRSDGTIYEVKNYRSQPKVRKLRTSLNEEQDVEGLAFDAGHNRLLLAIKEKEPGTNAYKGIYAYNLNTMEFGEEPVFKIEFKDPVFKKVDEKKPENSFKPSDLEINPSTGKLLVLEAENPKLLILDKNGDPEKLLFLNRKKFPQAEGLSISNTGTIYISNEGSPATIHRISLN
ncbi:MAG TPA: SdiA-regulated domain-containing protein [Salinimicrobium sp.]|nr:SdiA-regulated domain-containing protein [Salinimicrobium sp.]